ncbi:uncharacterized protein N0V89_003654 [Didymosphaeria variabile]|uniref:Rhodanese domain-containing protein n=1 Tax=Didymosphaeria variabile TaxID=1932322 RepID=A0A9W8XNS5_9PLEO|nr:uncharacterized protein N0V89_003654 [Didymosphaeria variabile]KAJ4355634.1 hypothetical protein N0V89_003654 [Didymosphaeria variabile]
MKILICGGGIAGNALAFWLSKTGHDVTILERFTELRATGLQVDLRGFGIQVLKRMGLEQKFREKTVKEEGLDIVDGSGRSKAYFHANRTGKGIQSLTTDYEIMRGDLCRLIYDAASRNATKYRFGTSIKSFEQLGGSIRILFTDGKQEEFDLLVGADGQWSRTRQMMLGTDKADPITLLGVYIAYFTMPSPIRVGEVFENKLFIATGKRFISCRRHAKDRVQGYLGCAASTGRLDDVKKGDVKAEKDAVVEMFKEAGWRTDELLEAMERSDDFYCERMGVVKMETWSKGRVALLGDAAYCPSATTGMGTTSSMVGAYILAGELNSYSQHREAGNGANIDAALMDYERKFRPFMDQVQRGLFPGTTYFHKSPTTEFGIMILRFVLGIIAFFNLDTFTKYTLREEVTDWQLPEYSGLLE